MKYITTVFASILVSVFMVAGVLLVDPGVSKAASRGDYVNTCAGGSLYLNAKEKRTYVLHNRTRRHHGLKPFCLNRKLTRAAREHSEDMIKRDYFSHNTKGSGLSPAQRLNRIGYNWKICAENIAFGSGSYGYPSNIMNVWMNSDGHRSNILNGKLREIGVGVFKGEYNGHKNVAMYTVDFGTR